MGSRRRSLLPFIGSFVLPASLFLLTLAVNGIVPFGGKTLLISDLDTQYVEFMAEYRRMLLGQGSFFYSWNAGLGMNFTALIAYYLASPFNFLLVLFPADRLPLAVSVITTLKLGCAGFAFGRYLNSRFAKDGAALTVFSAFYALSMYALGYAFNLMWLDALIWLPLLCALIEKLIGDERFFDTLPALTLLFALSFISQFYTAYMTGVFSALYLCVRLFARNVPLKRTLSVCLRFALCAGIAAGLSAFLLLPTYFVLKNNMGLMGQSFPENGLGFSPPSLLRKLFIGSFDGTKDCLPHIYCGIPALAGLVAYFLCERIPRREKIASFALGAVLILSFCFKPLDFLWHAMDHPSWFPYRYAFLFAFRMCVCAYEGFIRSEKYVSAGYIAAGVLLLITYFPAVSANRDIFELNAGFIAAGLLLALVGGANVRKAGLVILCAAELFVTCRGIIGGNVGRYTDEAEWRTFHAAYASETADLLPAQDEFYRLEKTEHRNYNDALGIGFPGMSHFSSTASSRQTEYLKRLGFDCYASWCTYNGGTEGADALIRVRYELDGGTIREMTVLPLFYYASNDYARFNFFSDDYGPLERQNALLRLLGMTDDLYTRTDLTPLSLVNLKETSDGDYVRISADEPAYAEYGIDLEPGGTAYLFVPDASLNVNVFVDTGQVISAARDYTAFPVRLEGEHVTVRVETTKDSFSKDVRLYTLNPDALEGLTVEAPSTVRTAYAEFLLRAEPAAQDRLIVSSVPFDSGWRVYADGQRLPLKMIHESVLGFVLPAGASEIALSFRPYGWEIGICLTGSAAVLWLLLLIFEKRKEVRK